MLVPIRHTKNFAIGQRVAGLNNRQYRVLPSLRLVACRKSTNNQFIDHATEGVHPDDVDYLLTPPTLLRRVRKAPAPPAITTPTPPSAAVEQVVAPPTATVSAPFDQILDESIDDLEAALQTGDLDPHLTELLASEAAGKNRKGALSAIQSRIDKGTE